MQRASERSTFTDCDKSRIIGLKQAGRRRRCRDARGNPQFPERPLWLLQEPKPLQLSVMPQIVAGPERIEGGWWDTGDVQRDYYVVHLSNGSSLWVYRDLGERGGWYLHGFWS